MLLDYYIARAIATRADNIALEAMPVRDTDLGMPAVFVTIRAFIVAMRIGAPFVPCVVYQKAGTALRTFIQSPAFLYVLAEFIHRRESKSRTSRS
jgi:hypothetical protein